MTAETDDALTILRGRLIPAQDGEAAEIPEGLVLLQGSAIRWAGPAAEVPAGLCSPRVLAQAEEVPLILPGLVDLHCHGGHGHTFGKDPEGARATAGFWARQGTTSVTASLVTAPTEELTRQITALRPLVESGELAGLHLEGPFLAPKMSGAQDPHSLIHGSAELLDQWIEAGRPASPHGGGPRPHPKGAAATPPSVERSISRSDSAVRTITLAPEIPGFGEVLRVCRAHGVVPSIGHTAATAAQVRAALEGPEGPGPWTATHLFNRMAPLSHRKPGPVPVLMCRAMEDPRNTTLELIADGVHLDPEIIRWVFAMVGADSVALITDSMAAAGMPDGTYALGAMEVEVREGQARLTGQIANPGALAGGTSTSLGNLRRCVAWGIPLPDAVRAASATPARILGLTDRGSITAGHRADLLITDENLTPLRVYWAGQRVQPETASA